MIASFGQSPLLAVALQACVGAAVGAVAGYVYFTALWWNVALFDKGATAGAVLLVVARFALLAAIFFLLAKSGAPPLLAGAVGLLIARRFAIRRFGGLS
jgi:F1F0 ATPase subunit 2